MKNLCTFLLLLLSLSPLVGQELTPGTTFADGQRLTAAELALLVSGATINPAFYTDKIAQTNIGSSDIILIYSPSSGTFHKVTGSQGIYGNVAIISGQQVYTTGLNTNYFLLGFDSTNNSLFQINFTNVIWTTSGFINVNALNFTNGLATYPKFTPLIQTNQLQILCYDTNGILSQLSVSNLILSLYQTLNTNLDIPYRYQQIFTPWTIYGTNNTTNFFNTNVLFPITNIFYGPSNLTTLTGTDTIPIASSLQGSNTVVNLNALYEYFTNLNALPAYTQARCQFSGIPVTFTITNANTTYGSLATSNNGYWASSPAYPAHATPYCINFMTNGPTFYFSPVQTNVPFYIVPFATNANWFRVYTNYATAVLQTNWVTIANTGIGSQHLLYLTNFTGFNADAIQTCAGQSINQAEYLICFRTPSPTPFYYVSGSLMSDPSHSASVVSLNLDPYNLINTNEVQVITVEAPNFNYQSPLIHVLCSPQ